MIAGLLVDDVPSVLQIVQEGGQHTFFDHGARMVQIERLNSPDGAEKPGP